MIDTCPRGCNLQGAPIPQEYIDKGYYGEGVTHYSRMIAIEVRGIYDGALFWKCPDCDARWHRHTDKRLMQATEDFWAENP